MIADGLLVFFFFFLMNKQDCILISSLEDTPTTLQNHIVETNVWCASSALGKLLSEL